jgi:flagellin-specific chaperone FliS
MLAFLIKTLDHKDKITKLYKDLDYLYKHCIFSLVRVRDYNDYEFLNSSIKVLSEISEGWERVTAAVVNNQQN